jgi:SAM-dependent methyltransferase
MHDQEHDQGRFESRSQSAEWDARYSEHDEAMWSGNPNGGLVAEAADLTPGRALDVGCGEGGDAIWLAERGWAVTAIDISDVAISRARQAATRAGVEIEWIRGDALHLQLQPQSFDLVSMQYPALAKAAGEQAVQALLNTLRQGGLLLAVYHNLDEEHREHMRLRGVDPTDYVGADDLVSLLGEAFTVESHSVKAGINPPPGTPHVADISIRARRR